MITWVSTEQLATHLKTPKSTLYKMLSSGQLKGHKVGRNYRFDVHEVDRLVKRDLLAGGRRGQR